MSRKPTSVIIAAVLVLGPALASAQVTTTPGRQQRQRLELEQRLHQRFGQTLRNRLAIGQEEMQTLQGVMGSFQEERLALGRAQASLRYRLRDPALRDMEEEAAKAFLQEMVELQQQELDLYRREQEQLLTILPPAKVVLFYRYREDLGQQVQRLRQGRGAGGGAGGGVGLGAGGRPGGGGGSGGRFFR